MSAVKVSAFSLLLLAGSSDAVQPRLRGGSLATLPIHLWRQDCGRPSGLSLMQNDNPGAGMTPEDIEPFTTVLKDGFYEVDCVKDYLFHHGDKFGNNKFDYKLQDISNVSIVHYDEHIKKEDREPMTRQVCFRFCRTVPEMSFFGITNGRDCYCAPYFSAMASDSSSCDEVCDGDNTMMCGGKSKSNVFSMHNCANTAQDLATGETQLQGAVDDLAMAVVAASPAWAGLTNGADIWQGGFSQGGDPGASDLLQTARVYAGTLEAKLAEATTLKDKATSLKGEITTLLSGEDHTSSEVVSKAEDLLESADTIATKADSEAEELQGLVKAEIEVREGADVEGAAKQYYPLTYFVNKSFEEAPSTCTGAASEKPIYATLDGCARACDHDVHECVGFSYFPVPSVPTLVQLSESDFTTSGSPGAYTEPESQASGVCFLMSKFKTLQYYSSCSKEEAPGFKCYGKLSKFEGTSLSPDGSGKCDTCLKDAVKADRCVVAASSSG